LQDISVKNNITVSNFSGIIRESINALKFVKINHMEYLLLNLFSFNFAL